LIFYKAGSSLHYFLTTGLVYIFTAHKGTTERSLEYWVLEFNLGV